MTATKALAKSPRCTVCRHKERPMIEKMRVAGVSLDIIASKFGVKRDAVARHYHNHVPDEVKAQYIIDAPLAEMASRAAEENISLIDYLALIRATVIQQMLLAASVNDRNAVANLAGRATDVLEKIGRITGQISSITSTSTTINFANSPDFLALEVMLIERLAPFHEARMAVMEGLLHFGTAKAPALLTGPSHE